MLKYIIGVVIFAVVATGGYYVWEYVTQMPQREPESVQLSPQQPATTTYATTTFSLIYPQNFSANELYQYEGVPKKPIDGVSFSVPLTMATGTTLSSDSYVSVEWLPRAQKCTGDIYIPANVKASAVTTNGVTYSVATTSGVAAGNLYEEQVFAYPSSSPCTAVRYFIHSTNIGNYDPGAVREFDRNALLDAFDAIRDSLRLTQ